MVLPSGLSERLKQPGRIILSGLLGGQDALVLPEIVYAAGTRGLVFVCRDDAHLAEFEDQLGYFAPALETMRFPAWDCLPYDRVSPSADILARRLATLTRLLEKRSGGFMLLTTVNAVLQRVLPPSLINGATFTAKPGMSISIEKLQSFLVDNGYSRVGTVVESGDFAVRGGLIDLFPPGSSEPVRLDFFGDTLEINPHL